MFTFQFEALIYNRRDLNLGGGGRGTASFAVLESGTLCFDYM